MPVGKYHESDFKNRPSFFLARKNSKNDGTFEVEFVIFGHRHTCVGVTVRHILCSTINLALQVRLPRAKATFIRVRGPKVHLPPKSKTSMTSAGEPSFGVKTISNFPPVGVT